MSKMKYIGPMPNRIEEIRRSIKLSMDELGERVGATGSQISKLEKGRQQLTEQWMKRLAQALGVEPMDLLEPGATARPVPPARPASRAVPADSGMIDPGTLPRMVPVYGTAAGAITGATPRASEALEWFPCPPALQKVRDAYGLYVIGESMVPRFRHGDPIYVNPNRPARQGDHVVIQEQRDGEIQVSIKRFERYTPDFLVTTQYNPPSEVKFKRSNVLFVHKVLDLAELLGI
jgi:phage repressor protein C with HTH and peptisase S24 domain